MGPPAVAGHGGEVHAPTTVLSLLCSLPPGYPLVSSIVTGHAVGNPRGPVRSGRILVLELVVQSGAEGIQTEAETAYDVLCTG